MTLDRALEKIFRKDILRGEYLHGITTICSIEDKRKLAVEDFVLR